MTLRRSEKPGQVLWPTRSRALFPGKDSWEGGRQAAANAPHVQNRVLLPELSHRAQLATPGFPSNTRMLRSALPREELWLCWTVTLMEASLGPALLLTRQTYSPESAAETCKIRRSGPWV